MKKSIILVSIIILLSILILLLSLLIFNFNSKEPTYNYSPEEILSSSSWVDLTKEDFNSLVLKSSSEKITSIINSLENAVPVIVKENGGQFSNGDNYNYVIASAFASSNTIYIYIKNNGTYEKSTTTLEELLENSVSFLLLDNTEVLK